MAAGGGGTRRTSEVKASLGRRSATSFGEAGGGSALEQRETGERDDGKENEESVLVQQGVSVE
jgi:hypothetical protein